jgi:hypothetical protein
MDRKLSRKVRETRSSSGQKRSERGREVLTAHWVRYPFPEKLGPQLVEKKSEQRGVQAARNGPSLPPCVAEAEISTADRLGSREVVTRSCGKRASPGKPRGHGHRGPSGRPSDDLGASVVSGICRQPRQQSEASGVWGGGSEPPVAGVEAAKTFRNKWADCDLQRC